MTEFHMLSLTVNLRELRRQAAIRGFGNDEGRSLHHFLSEVFGKGAAQPFRLLANGNASHATLYAYTLQSQTTLKQTATETGTPELSQMLSIKDLKTKEMPASWAVGRRLAFDVFVRPVRRLRTPLSGPTNAKATKLISAGAEVDAFLVEAMRGNPDEIQAHLPTLKRREDCYRTWLKERIKGADLIEIATRMVAYERRKVARGGSQVEGPDATFHGELKITDPDTFAKLLCSGVGRHSAYGYGMLLLRPARN